MAANPDLVALRPLLQSTAAALVACPVASLGCELNRGSATNPLFLVNYWLNNVGSLATGARWINAYDRMWPYISATRATCSASWTGSTASAERLRRVLRSIGPGLQLSGCVVARAGPSSGPLRPCRPSHGDVLAPLVG
jgi:hypothetical protein